MKTIVKMLFAFMVFAPCLPVGASPGGFGPEVFRRANGLYEGGDYQGALELYRQYETHGAHWKLYYNIGNCYYKLNRPVRAKIYYLRAQRLEPFDESIRKNIRIVDKLLKDRVPARAPDFIERLVLRLESFLSLNLLSVLLLLTVLSFNVFLFMLVKKGKNRPLIYGVSFMLIILLVVGFYHIYRVEKHNRRGLAVITQQDSRLHSAPGADNTVLFKVHPGLTVRIVDRSREWVQVAASSDIAGWVPAENLEVI